MTADILTIKCRSSVCWGGGFYRFMATTEQSYCIQAGVLYCRVTGQMLQSCNDRVFIHYNVCLLMGAIYIIVYFISRGFVLMITILYT